MKVLTLHQEQGEEVKNVMINIGKAVCIALVFATWVVACPEVERYQRNGECVEASTYAALVTKVRPCG